MDEPSPVIRFEGVTHKAATSGIRRMQQFLLDRTESVRSQYPETTRSAIPLTVNQGP